MLKKIKSIEHKLHIRLTATFVVKEKKKEHDKCIFIKLGKTNITLSQLKEQNGGKQRRLSLR